MNAAEVSPAVSPLVTLLLPVASGFAGVLIGGWLSSRREESERRLAFVEKQLSGFYSPMQGLREEIASSSALRLQIQQTAERAWREICAQVPKGDEAALARVGKERADEFNRIIEFDTDKLQKELLPAYRRMADLFRENYWLAQKETRVYYPAVLEYVEIWERWIGGSLPVEVWRKLNHTEDNLAGFYRHVSSIHDELRLKLERGSA
jgi:hypothetical protein